ncbi:hypothetical protein ABZ252_15765 [Streptomyces sp. NPDC006175]|uniref:hypothetical protein n=1 Tax=Streptomyces sp. NPDC006175 TaxID=3154471 RepID=UPI0033AF43C3
MPDSKLLTDSEGFTLYRFDRDTAEPPRANCARDCPKKWPAVPPMERNGVDGVTTKGFVTFDRPDGVEKQSLDCWPLCAFSGDTRPGYANVPRCRGHMVRGLVRREAGRNPRTMPGRSSVVPVRRRMRTRSDGLPHMPPVCDQ